MLLTEHQSKFFTIAGYFINLKAFFGGGGNPLKIQLHVYLDLFLFPALQIIG